MKLDPFSFEYSSLWKLQAFVAQHKVEENRFLSSPDLMKFRENNLEDETIQQSLNVWNTHKDIIPKTSYELENEEFIDIESVDNCSVTSTTDKVTICFKTRLFPFKCF